MSIHGFEKEGDFGPEKRSREIKIYDNSEVPIIECLCCGQEACTEVDWGEAADGRAWEIEVRCLDCGELCVRHATDEMAGNFDDRLIADRGTLELNYKHTKQENTKEWVENFTRALRDDHILPEDF